MIPPSSSTRSIQTQSSHHQPSSLSSRPSSSLSEASRPPSSASRRPASSLTPRPPSSTSHWPPSRYSQRPHSRQAKSRLVPACQTLISQVAGLREDGSKNDQTGERFKSLVDYALKNLEATTINKASASVDMFVIDRHISGHALKARVNLQNKLGGSLEVCYQKLKDHIKNEEADLDQDIKTNRIPDHIQFLIALSQPPSAATLVYADAFFENTKHPSPPLPSFTWAEILAEEPFEGEDWEGILEVARDDWESTPSLSPLYSDDLAFDGGDSIDSEHPVSPEPSQLEIQEPVHSIPPHTFEHRKAFEDLKARQYWQKGWCNDVDTARNFDLGDPSTLGPAIHRALAHAQGVQVAHGMLSRDKYIDEEDMVREVFIALQGRHNLAYSSRDGIFSTTSSTPRLVHLSLASQASILSSLGSTLTTIEHLRRFVTSIMSHSSSNTTSSHNNPAGLYGTNSNVTRTMEAFADAVDIEVRRLDTWCATREEEMCRASMGINESPLVVSLLDVEKAIRDEFEASFDVLFQIVDRVFTSHESDGSLATPSVPRCNRQTPATMTSNLLDTLFATVQEHMERRATVTSNILMRVFVRTAEPIWGMVGKWLRDGMNIRGGIANGNPGGLDEEFFIESSGVGVGMTGMGLLDPDFWKEGYDLREQVLSSSGEENSNENSSVKRRKSIPSFLEHVAEMILGSGKAVGLIRALGLTPSANDILKWRSFPEIINPRAHEEDGELDVSRNLFSISIDTLSRLIYDNLLPRCQETGSLLAKLLVEECELWRYLGSIEDLFLMRKGDSMTHFIDIIFAKMDAKQSWGDFHFLNSAFGDIINANLNAGVREWIQLSLVRISYRGHRDKEKTINRTVKGIDGLLVEYAVPFPLTYIFRPEVIQVYSEIFVFLLQIRRAKNVLEKILVRGERGRDQRLREELKVFYALRSRFSWFINVLLNFLTTYVIHAQIMKFHDQLSNAISLDDMIRLHDEHLDKIQGRCLLKSNTSVLHRSIISILDMCLYFSDVFIAAAGETTITHDVSRQSISIRHRSRRQRQQRRNVIGFSQPLRGSETSSDDDDDDLDQELMEPSTSILASSTSMADDDFYTRLDKISSELDGLVRFLRRGVESLASGSSEAASAFGVLAFALEDWDL